MGEIDFIAVYIVPKNLWYVVPIAVAELHWQLYFFPERAGSRSANEIYREAWCQMACPRDGAPSFIRVDFRCGQEGHSASCPLPTNEGHGQRLQTSPAERRAKQGKSHG
jgi:hypothetical protein